MLPKLFGTRWKWHLRDVKYKTVEAIYEVGIVRSFRHAMLVEGTMIGFGEDESSALMEVEEIMATTEQEDVATKSVNEVEAQDSDDEQYPSLLSVDQARTMRRL